MAWEYKAITAKNHSELETTLNELGKAKWELVAVQYEVIGGLSGTWIAFLKRPA